MDYTMQGSLVKETVETLRDGIPVNSIKYFHFDMKESELTELSLHYRYLRVTNTSGLWGQ